jgi:hypothetical protein
MLLNSSTKEGYKHYIDYLALKKHFETDDYDYHKYNGKIKASIEAFRSRPDSFFFQKLSRQTNPHERLLANIVENPKIWIRDIVDDQGNQVYLNWKKRIEAISYNFTQDLNKLNENYKSNFIVNKGQHPYLMTLFLKKEISLETASILFNISKVADYWCDEIIDKYIARDIIRLLKKYYPFLQIEQNKFIKIIKDRFFTNN